MGDIYFEIDISANIDISLNRLEFCEKISK